MLQHFLASRFGRVAAHVVRGDTLEPGRSTRTTNNMTDPHNEPGQQRADEPFEIWNLTNSCNEFICSFETLLLKLWTLNESENHFAKLNLPDGIHGPYIGGRPPGFHNDALMEAIREVLTVGNELLEVAGEFHDVHWRGIRGERIIWSSQSPLPRFHGANAHRFVCDIAGNYRHALDNVWPDNRWLEFLQRVAVDTDLRDVLQDLALPSLLESEAQRFVSDVQTVAGVQSSVDSGQVMNDTTETDEAEVFNFYPDGDGYRIDAFGQSGHVPIKGATGLHDIFRLIRSPSTPVEMLELQFGEPVVLLPGEKRTKQQMADAETLRTLKAEKSRLLDEICSAENDAERNDSKRRLDEVTAEGQKMFDHNGKPRNMNDPWGKPRSAINKRLDKAYWAIAINGLPRLAQNLKPLINAAGDSYVYRPGDKPPEWRFSKEIEK